MSEMIQQTEADLSQPEKQPEKQSARPNKLQLSARIVWLAAQGLLLVAFLAGVCAVNGTNMSVVGGVTSVIEIFFTKWKLWYYYVATFAQGVWYLFIGVLLVKEFVQTLLRLRKKEDDASQIEKGFAVALKRLVLYVMISGTLFPVKLTVVGIVAFILALVVFVGAKVLHELSLPERPSWIYLLTSAGKRAFVLLVLALLAPKVNYVCVEGIIDGFTVFGYITFGGNSMYVLYRKLFVSLFYAALIGIYLRIVEVELLELAEKRRNIWLAFLIVAAIFAGLDIVLFLAVVLGGSKQEFFDKLGDYFVGNSSIFTMTLLAIAGKLTAYFPAFDREGKFVENVKKKKEKPVSPQPQPMPQPFPPGYGYPPFYGYPQPPMQGEGNGQQPYGYPPYYGYPQPPTQGEGNGQQPYGYPPFYGYPQPPMQGEGNGQQPMPGYWYPPYPAPGYGYPQPPAQPQGETPAQPPVAEERAENADGADKTL